LTIENPTKSSFLISFAFLLLRSY